ncbi:MAG: nitroreductase family protein [Desulfomonile tiedjei]|nr:nitroreductase family protein [Desulfomonile tiedjei]
MTLFTVDRETCQRDGLCEAVCPMKLIEIASEQAFPTPIEGAEEFCINCGHCVAVCPHAALSLQTMNPADCPPVRKELVLGPEHAEHFLRYRRSIRNYREKVVDRETLTRLIRMASCAPSGHNLQPVHWLVIGNADGELRHLAGLVVEWMRTVIERHPEMAEALHLDRVVAAWERGQDMILRSAPHLIVAHGDQTVATAQSACTIALTYLELAATSLGLGACWAGYFNRAATVFEPLTEALSLPTGHQCFGAMMIGYQRYGYQRLPLRKAPAITWR